MKVVSEVLGGVKLLEPTVRGDERGFFMESWSKSTFETLGIECDFIQDNHSKSSKGILRGMHFQWKHPQDKLVRVVAGSVYDVVVDCRKNSPTYGEWFGAVLSAQNKRQLFVPQGFAHGFLSLEDNTEFLYKVSNIYDPSGEDGIIRNDSHIGIDREECMKKYSISSVILSEKDKKLGLLKNLPEYF